MGEGIRTLDIKKQDREALRWILDYSDMRKTYAEQTAAFTELAATSYSGMPHGSGISNPCMNKAVTLVDLDRLKLQLMVVENMEKTLSEKKKAFLDFRRRAEVVEQRGVGRPPWGDYVQIRYANWHEQRYGHAFVPSRRVMTCWMAEIVDVTVRIGIKTGVL